MKQGLKIVLASALITAAAIRAVPALAADAGEPQTFTSRVHTADLNLSTPDGQQALDTRLTRAVREVCGEASDADLAGKNEVRRCRETTLASARTQRDTLIASVDRGGVIMVAAAR